MGGLAVSICIAPLPANLGTAAATAHLAPADEQEEPPAAPEALRAAAGDPDPGAAVSTRAGWRLGLGAALRTPPLPRQV
jgi:hypothetical protein